MADDDQHHEVPDGAAVFPLIPDELGVDPLLLAALHAVVFLIGSDEEVAHPAAAEEALQYIAGYVQRLNGRQLAKVKEDLAALISFARQDGWRKHEVQFLKSFLKEMGIEEE